VTSQLPWRPILDKNLAVTAHERIAQIASALERYRDGAAKDIDPTLAWGAAGIALFFASEDDGTESAASGGRQAGVARAMLTAAMKGTDDRWRTPHLYTGLVGLAWALVFLHNEFNSPVDVSLDELEEQLLAICHDTDCALEADLIYGLVGIGVYALERWPAAFALECIPLIIEHLAQANKPDLGLAHGMAGVIAFLAAVSRLDGNWRQRIAPIIAGHVEALVRHRLPANEVNCAFPSLAGGGPDRLAWCLGDTSIAVAFLAAGTAFGRADWRDMATQLALAAAERPSDLSGAVDGGLCHGAAGLGHLFNRLFQVTGEERLAVAAREWFRRALHMPAQPNGIAGFSAWKMTDAGGWHWAADCGFLEGAAGIGLALRAAVGVDEPAWDRVLLLSSRVPAPV
jgi:lantibiotic modifying enzyme